MPVGFLWARRNHDITVPEQDRIATTHTTTANLTAKITPNDRGNSPGKLADAEFHFNDGPLAGLKLSGFTIWEGRGGTSRAVSQADRLGDPQKPSGALPCVKSDE